ncbi:amiloride-sensitive sodium channel subunit beta-like isoform X2 [Ruditapes philippinarum]|uniref:amiloride-sensitive sodium channel subunit beta-like isoform X2 n=1 Tax=Ruditapes philippinarum TaxID=129788 RepID=UPI00295B8E01|nr:amiloride-sensitive sodium channel subunit beta-like isoform X2 [Ruditapes philippinarum]
MTDKTSRDTMKETASNESFDSTGKKKSFRRLISRFAEKTSMVGVAYIDNAKFWWAKIIWSIMLLAALAAMTLHLWYLIDQYTQWPVQTKIALGFETLPFPEVTICNTNIMHRGRFDKFSGAKELKILVKELQPENLVPDQFDPNYDPYKKPSGNGSTDPPKRRKRFVPQYDNFNTSQFDRGDKGNPRAMKESDTDDFDGTIDSRTLLEDLLTELYMDIGKRERAELGHNISDMLVSCTFNGRQCSANMFRLHQTAEYGNCWSIRSDKFNVKNSGPSGGLSLVLYLEMSEYLKGVTTGYGVRMQIHEQETYPFPYQEGHFVPASMETDVGLRMVAIHRQDGKYGDCDRGNSFNTNYEVKYSRRACQIFCEISKVIEICNCFGNGAEEFPGIKNSTMRPCRSKSEVLCMVDIQRQFENQVLSCTCDNPCDEVHYLKATSQRQWPADEYAMVLLEGICERDKDVCVTMRKDINDQNKINNNFLKLNIYYEDLNYENITQVPEIEVQQFLSDVGGAIGLWIGLSILSLCELVQLFVECCDYGIHKTVRERRQNKKRLRKERKRHGETNGHNAAAKDESLWPRTNYGYDDESSRNKFHYSNKDRDPHPRQGHSGNDAVYNRPYTEDFNGHTYYSGRI